jgi:heme A synthase
VLTLLVVELAQGTIGFVQYFTDLPVVLVGFHLLGAALVSATATWMLLVVRETGVDKERTTAGLHPRGQALPSSSH